MRLRYVWHGCGTLRHGYGTLRHGCGKDVYGTAVAPYGDMQIQISTRPRASVSGIDERQLARCMF